MQISLKPQKKVPENILMIAFVILILTILGAWTLYCCLEISDMIISLQQKLNGTSTQLIYYFTNQ
jgi:hypothetical protein